MNNFSIVSGGAGFIGSHMVDYLVKKKHKVIIIDDFSTGKILNIKKHLKKKKIFIIKKKIENLKYKDIKKISNTIKYIFHFAGKGSIVPSIENPNLYIKVNSFGTLNLLEQTKHFNYKKFIYAASSSCYGKANYPTTENNKISTLYPYALSKYIGEQLCLHWSKVYKLPINSIRIFNAYGERISFDNNYGAMFPIFMKQFIKKMPFTIVGTGNQKRDFLYVKDLVDAFFKTAESKNVGEVYNLGSGKPISINQITKLIGGKKTYIKKRPGEPDVTHASITKIKKHTGWYPKTSIKKGVEIMKKNKNYWKNSILWDEKKIEKATKSWFDRLK
jgi:UDP-glucose 4-epimerase